MAKLQANSSKKASHLGLEKEGPLRVTDSIMLMTEDSVFPELLLSLW